MKILFNPKEGATISNVNIDRVIYFDRRDGKEWKPNTMLKIEDDKVAYHLMGIFSFLAEYSPLQAKKWLENKDKEVFKCDYEGCNFESASKAGLTSHQRVHQVDIDLPVIGAVNKGNGEQKEKTEAETSAEIEAETKKAGLEGEGLVEEPRNPVVFH